MKKFFKNALLIMLVSSFIFNVLNLILQHIRFHTGVLELADIIRQINSGEIVIENTYDGINQLLASSYYMLAGNNLAIQTWIVVLSIVLGITVGMIITFEEKSKIRVVIIYIVGLLLTILAPTMSEVIYYMSFQTFFDDMLYYLKSVWKWYTLVFFIMYTIKIYINIRKTRELNEILTKKQKQNNLGK